MSSKAEDHRPFLFFSNQVKSMVKGGGLIVKCGLWWPPLKLRPFNRYQNKRPVGASKFQYLYIATCNCRISFNNCSTQAQFPAQRSLSSPIFTWRWMLGWRHGLSHSVAQHWNKLQTSAIQFWIGGRQHMKIQQYKSRFSITGIRNVLYVSKRTHIDLRHLE